MDAKIECITPELKTFFDLEFCKEYFTIIYGSYPYEANTPNSDLDFVTVTKNFNQNNLRNTLDFAFDLYRRYSLVFDDEVPHEKKLLADYATLDAAIAGKCFERRAGRIYVPPVVKTNVFLNSDEIVMRLLLNAITSKNIFVSGDKDYYFQKRQQAFENMIGFMFSINNVESFTIPEFVQSLIGTPDRCGEMYLGYKDKPAVRRYLAETFRTEFDKLVTNHVLKKKKGSYFLLDLSWAYKLGC